ncbi:DNA-binding domain-containing protein [Salipiger sp. 1_MG-2023]|uniref:HvfC/BufC N-terminal domain-containing protein n=1 Tax=Salipiger sp. 1_MG-2023 TaxID=3062665 RepID=UPI0026E490F0|nr:DNA-binding domain-containing protein [Salipiger sp. 1_MG-2023]MDO6586763.1 DNA-binding domain-containing protein [Salipiger sp. 1_MG-2023]
MSEPAFAAALLSDAPPPVGADRFEVYRGSVTGALTATLREAFPAVRRLVGDAFFDAMAREFLRAHPPRSPIMALYGDALPGWLARFAPLSALPWLPEVAAIEQARREATHAADAVSLDPARLAEADPDALRLAPHPSVRLLRTRYPALSIWARNADRPDLEAAPAGEVLITRPALSLQIAPAPNGTADTLAALSQGTALGDALPQGTDHAAILACLFSAGALIERPMP